MKADKETEEAVRQLTSMFNPIKLLLFGSQARGDARPGSDIDLCVVAEAEDKRDLLTDMYLRIDCGKPFDLLLYTPEEWERSVADEMSFAHKINREGVILYARQR